MTFTITIKSDMQQQFVFRANSVGEALDAAKLVFTDSMVVGTPQGKLHANRLSDRNRIVKTRQVINPPKIWKTKEERRQEKEREYQKTLDSVPD